MQVHQRSVQIYITKYYVLDHLKVYSHRTSPLTRENRYGTHSNTTLPSITASINTDADTRCEHGLSLTVPRHLTRMHSSRMPTVHSSSRLPGGVVCWDMPAQKGGGWGVCPQPVPYGDLSTKYPLACVSAPVHVGICLPGAGGGCLPM